MRCLIDEIGVSCTEGLRGMFVKLTSKLRSSGTHLANE
jgi:hypothetical protein